MTRRKKRLAIAAVTATMAVGGLGTGVAGQQLVSAKTVPVTFTATPFTAPTVAHYSVTAAQRSAAPVKAASGGSSQDQLPDLNPKHPGRGHSAHSAAPSVGASAVTVTTGNTAPPTTSSFIGQQGSNVTCSYFAQGCNPPDMGLAAGPRFVLQGVNTQWEVLNTSGTVQSGWPVSAQRFFNVPNVTQTDGTTPCDTAHRSQPFLSDPRGLYDATDHRFWAAELQVEGGLGIAPDCPFKSVYFIAVSQTSDPNGSWNVYEFDMAAGANFAADYTQVGFNGNAFFFSANMFGNTGGFYAEILEANKAQMEAGHATFTADGFRNLQATGPGTTTQTGAFIADTVQPVMTIGSGSADGLFVDTIDGPDLVNGHFCTSAADACKGLAMWRMGNPVGHDSGGAAPTLKGTYLPNTKPFYMSQPQSFSTPGDQPSCSACIDGLDLRITATPVLRNGTIYAAWETAHSNATQVVPTIEWGQIRLGGHPSLTTGYFGFSGDTAASFGALMPDADGNLVMVYERMSHTIFPEVRYTVRHAGHSNFTDAGALLKAGEASYRPTLCGTTNLPICRWGDFNATSFDGAGHLWFAGEYANSNTAIVAPAFGRNWGTWIGAVATP